jgi:uncharacterized protein (TIGR02687 family)
MSKIADALSRLFEKHRIILWYDPQGNFEQAYEDLVLPSVEKCTINNNEFTLKYRILIKEPKTKFLLYGRIDKSAQDENWLLDIELSNCIFQTDQEALILQELELPIHYKHWVSKHLAFFNSKDRVSRFAAIFDRTESEDNLTRTLIRTVLNTSTDSLDEILKAYITAFIHGKVDSLEKEMTQYNLRDYFWAWVSNTYYYHSPAPGIYDFVLDVLQKNFGPLSSKATVNRSTEVLLSSWKDTRSFSKIYRKLVERVETDLNIQSEVQSIQLNDLLDEDVFESVDKKIIRETAEQIERQSNSAEKIEATIKLRESCYWYEKYSDFYSAIRYANWLMADITKYENITISDYQDGFSQYTSKWYLIDQNYRKFIQHYRATNQNNVLHSLYNVVHRAYSNTWLLKLSDAWQQVIESSDGWYFGANSQRQFFSRAVKGKYLDRGTTIFVVISDALRYECGQELHELFEQESRFSSKLEYQITGLPSYTQLGMAALLPHQQLSFGDGDAILIDGKSTQGAQARKKVLEEGSGVKATTILAEDLMSMASRSEEARKLVQDHQVVYVYHNRIDKTGDEKTTELKVFEASKEEIEFLVEVTRKITNMNGNHVIITADHGFIYQHEALEESDFTDPQITGEVIKDNRRFVLGRNLTHNNSMVGFNASQLQISSDLDVLLPKGINRLRKQGAGSRYVHGGSTLQEVVVPILFVAKMRSDTTTKVEVDVLKGINRITTNLQRVRFFQQQPIGNGIVPRTIKSYFCVIEGEHRKIISDIFSYNFDSSSTRAEDREVEYKFTISTMLRKSTSVYLIIEEPVEKSNRYINLLKLPYTLNLAMENDFDDF